MNEVFVLILTLAVSGQDSLGSAGMGGVATAEFNTKAACENAASEWEKQFRILKSGSNESNLSGVQYKSMKTKMINAICVPKG